MSKLTDKKLNKTIEAFYVKAANGKAINIMDIGKVFRAGRDAYAATADLAVVDAAVTAAVAVYCEAP